MSSVLNKLGDILTYIRLSISMCPIMTSTSSWQHCYAGLVRREVQDT